VDDFGYLRTPRRQTKVRGAAQGNWWHHRKDADTDVAKFRTRRNLGRRVYATVPPRVEYSISELGWSLTPVLDAIIDWSHGNLGKVFAARAAYEKKKVREATLPERKS